MANAVALHDCRFQWDIHNPFIPWEDMEATFYQASPTVTQWKVTLQPMTRYINYWMFSFSLEFDTFFDRREEIVADRLVVLMRLDGRLEERREDPNHRFYGTNGWKYYFEKTVSVSALQEPHHLQIIIEISLIGGNVLNAVGSGLFFREDDLRFLARDLNLLQNDSRHFNMELMPRNSPRPILAHSYILHARWDNFYCLHDFEPGLRYRVETNISPALLKDILTYMYSGTFDPRRRNAAYTTELFKVIDRYKLYHLYQVFAKSDLNQLRVTRIHGIVESQLFQLEFINGRRIARSSYSWEVRSDAGYEFIFRIRVGDDNRARPWLSYSLQFISPPSRVYAKVNMQVLKRENGNSFGRPFPFHERDFIIEAEATVRSGRVLFLGCPETFGDSGGTEIEYYILCSLNVNDGTKVEQIMCTGDDESAPTSLNDLARFGVLSDHMYKLRKQPEDDDMRIQSRWDGPEVPDQANIHKGIFAIRVSEWWKGLGYVRQEANVRQGANDLPYDVNVALSDDTFPIVLDYMYTVKETLGRSEGPQFRYQANIQQGIFAIRVPEWWKGLGYVRKEANDLPYIANATLSEVNLPIVLDYMYTG